ncbi:Hypothetical predicted protein [Cloeon dipterum]|uniref:t-SNARE coiled-coil homology domain-containing protein n=1 Tax=Cloeon dipterum TaxID=197152 RepID=A0A8S1E0E4_9INSE|nr:Hypothetical predicted protein [Cloeon dipterum]
MRDRLRELQEKMASEGQDNRSKEDDVMIQIGQSPQAMKDFFEEVNSIRENLTLFEKDVQHLSLIHQTMNSLSPPSEMSKREASITVQNARTKAMAISRQIKGLPSKMPEPRTASSSRILAIHESTLSMQLKRTLESLYNEQNRQREKAKQILHKQLTTVRSSMESRGESMTDAQLEQLLDNGASIFTGNHSAQTLMAKRDLDDIQMRHDELLALEKSIEEVRDLFADIALLVHNQGEMVDNIEMNVASALGVVEQGKTQLLEANKKNSSLRKKKYICAIGTVLVIITLILVLAFLVP